MKDAIRYTVTVTATVRRKEIAGREWKPLTNEPSAKCDYTPEIEKMVDREVTVLKQEMGTLNIRSLVAVLNNLPMPGPLSFAPESSLSLYSSILGKDHK